jgi:hypothetical protein
MKALRHMRFASVFTPLTKGGWERVCKSSALALAGLLLNVKECKSEKGFDESVMSGPNAFWLIYFWPQPLLDHLIVKKISIDSLKFFSV